MNEEFQELTPSELRKFLIEEIKRFNSKLESGGTLMELNETRKHIRRIYILLEESEKIELRDIFGNNFMRALLKEG